MASSNMSPFEIEDFSGGITDHVFDQSAKNKAQTIDNFLVNGDRKPYTRPGSVIENETYGEVPTGARVSALINYANNNALLYFSLKNCFFRNPSVFNELKGPTGNELFSIGTASAAPSIAQWNRHLYLTSDQFPRPMKIYKDTGGTFQLRTAGLPALETNPVLSSAPGTNNYIYAFYRSYDYTVMGLSFQSIGPTIQVELNNIGPIGTVTITGIPVLTNVSGDNYDTANIKVQIFRTTNDGTFFQKVGEVTNGTTVFTDTTTDTVLQDSGVPLYTNDGTVDFDPPPLHKFGHVVSNTGYYAHITDADGISPYKIRQSIPGVPDTAPIDFEVSVDDEVEGISSVRNIPIVLCKKYIYRIESAFDQFGRGQMIPVRISDTAGCISHNSCVQAENGLFWLGNEGVWYTDGYMAQKISDDINDSYKSMIENTTLSSFITGRFFEKERLVKWSTQRNSSSLDMDSLLVLDLKFGVSNSSTFTTWSGTSFRPTAIEVFNRQFYRGDVRGYVFKHDPLLKSDPKIDIYKTPDLWAKETIIWTLKSIHYNFNGTFFRKMPTRILLSAADAGNTTIQITAVNDDGKRVRNCKPIRVRSDFVWGADDFVWRITDFIWRGTGMIEQWRRFPKGGLRLSYLQVIITNGFSEVTNSDTLGTGTFDDTLNTVTLDVATSKWPEESVDYYISTVDDGYVARWLISERTDTVLTVLDPLDTFPSGAAKKWIINGYKKDEVLYLLGYNIHWTNVSQTQKAYSSAADETGQNA